MRPRGQVKAYGTGHGAVQIRRFLFKLGFDFPQALQARCVAGFQVREHALPQVLILGLLLALQFQAIRNTVELINFASCGSVDDQQYSPGRPASLDAL